MHQKLGHKQREIESKWTFFERKVCTRILGPVYENEKEKWRILNNKEIYANVKKPTIIDTIRLNRLCWFGHVQRMEENRIPKKVLYMNLETTRLRVRPRNRWHDEVREDGRLVGGKGWKERVYSRQDGKKLLRMARNRQILHMSMEWMNEWICQVKSSFQTSILNTIHVIKKPNRQGCDPMWFGWYVQMFQSDLLLHSLPW